MTMTHKDESSAHDDGDRGGKSKKGDVLMTQVVESTTP